MFQSNASQTVSHLGWGRRRRSRPCSGRSRTQSCSCDGKKKEKLKQEGRVSKSRRVFRRFRSPEALEHARGDALASHHADHPDAADAADGRLRRGGAAPGPLPLKHHLLSLRALGRWLLDHPVTLEGIHMLSHAAWNSLYAGW